jgi:hypothetical protein
MEVSPGVYTAHTTEELPLPITGYDIYVLGEIYGTREIPQFCVSYLQSLHQSTDLSTIIIEHACVYEKEANDYVLGKTETLAEELCQRKALLEAMRSYNDNLPLGHKISVRFIDIDHTLPAIRLHFQRIQEEFGSSAHIVEIPSLYTLEQWNIEESMEYVDRFENISSDASFLNQLEIIKASLQVYFVTSKKQRIPLELSGPMIYCKEAIYAKTIKHIYECEGAPLLAVVGSIHAQKSELFFNGYLPEFTPWVQRLREEGIRIYSLSISGVVGKIHWWGGLQQINSTLYYLQYSDGTLLASLWLDRSEYPLLYVDLNRNENTALLWSGPDLEVPIYLIYDGIIYFQKVTPLDFTCPHTEIESS